MVIFIVMELLEGDNSASLQTLADTAGKPTDTSESDDKQLFTLSDCNGSGKPSTAFHRVV